MYAKLVNNLDELGFTDVEPFLSDYLNKASLIQLVLMLYLSNSHRIKININY